MKRAAHGNRKSAVRDAGILLVLAAAFMVFMSSGVAVAQEGCGNAATQYGMHLLHEAANPRSQVCPTVWGAADGRSWTDSATGCSYRYRGCTPTLSDGKYVAVFQTTDQTQAGKF